MMKTSLEFLGVYGGGADERVSIEVEWVAPSCALAACPTWTSFVYSSCLQGAACHSSMVPCPAPCFVGTLKVCLREDIDGVPYNDDCVLLLRMMFMAF
jgi:hypothetical protein